MILQAKDVSYAYAQDKKILHEVNASFSQGCMYAILGVSGSGKTTFLSLLAGLDVPTEGSVCYKGEALRRNGLNDYRRRSVSLIFQNYNLIDYLTAYENVKLGGKRDAGALLDRVRITIEDRHRSILKLSGGQQQRVAIARALSREADILLADEPTGNLDSATAQDIVGILKTCAHHENKCVIVITHSLELADKADVVFSMKDGRLG
jgi:putative ABC transport system ATP-binding protein